MPPEATPAGNASVGRRTTAVFVDDLQAILDAVIKSPEHAAVADQVTRILRTLPVSMQQRMEAPAAQNKAT